MLTKFQKFYRETSEAWTERVLYPEAAPHIMLQAWLQRIARKQVEREYALGTGRADILVRYPYPPKKKQAEQRFVLELKEVLDGRSLDSTIRAGLKQTAKYADKCNPYEAHLIVVDPRKRSWDEKVYVKELSFEGRAITVWGM